MLPATAASLVDPVVVMNEEAHEITSARELVCSGQSLYDFAPHPLEIIEREEAGRRGIPLCALCQRQLCRTARKILG